MDPPRLARRLADGRGDGLPSNDINVLFQDRMGVIWVGTAKGIAIVEPGRGGRIRGRGTSGIDSRIRR